MHLDRTRVLVLIAAAGLAVASIAGAAGQPRTAVLELQAGPVDTSRPGLAVGQVAGPASAGRHFVIQLTGPMRPAWRAALDGAGVKLGNYLPTNAFIVTLDAADPAKVGPLPFIRWCGEYQDAWKLNPEIGKRPLVTAERQRLKAAGKEAVVVTLFAGADPNAAYKAIWSLPGAQTFSEDFLGDNLTVWGAVGAQDLAKLASIPQVQYVEPAPEVTLRNTTDRWIVQSNVQNVTPFYDKGIHGEGQVVGILDEKVNQTHCSFIDQGNPIGPSHRKILAYNTSAGYGLHGTHVAGTAVGDANTSGDTRGVAYLGKLVYAPIPSFSENGVNNALTLHHNQGARAHTNSWGNDGTTQYDSLCRGFDVFQYNNETSMVCLAVTNLNSLKNPENAKNLLAVGASQDTPNQANHCSGGQGPTADGRRKPEIYAPGCNTTSSSGSGMSCSVTGLTGTSMASPAIAGTGLLVRQYFADGYYPSGTEIANDAFTPSGTLVKAALLNSAVDMTGVAGYPSNKEGWGRVLADNVCYFAGDARKLIVKDQFNASGLSTGGSEELVFNVATPGQQLRVTLAFTEPAGAAGSQNPVVNNLDLVVTAPDGVTVYKGNVFTNGVSSPGGSADAKNNVEQVHVSNPTAGAWKARVVGTAVQQGKQGFALVITGDVVTGSGECFADCNADGTLDIDDFICFQTLFGLGNIGADCDLSGTLDVDDFICFQTAFGVGCP